MARLKYNAQLEQALQDVEDDYTGQQLCCAAKILQYRLTISNGINCAHLRILTFCVQGTAPSVCSNLAVVL